MRSQVSRPRDSSQHRHPAGPAGWAQACRPRRARTTTAVRRRAGRMGARIAAIRARRQAQADQARSRRPGAGPALPARGASFPRDPGRPGEIARPRILTVLVNITTLSFFLSFFLLAEGQRLAAAGLAPDPRLARAGLAASRGWNLKPGTTERNAYISAIAENYPSRDALGCTRTRARVSRHGQNGPRDRFNAAVRNPPRFQAPAIRPELAGPENPRG